MKRVAGLDEEGGGAAVREVGRCAIHRPRLAVVKHHARGRGGSIPAGIDEASMCTDGTCKPVALAGLVFQEGARLQSHRVTHRKITLVCHNTLKHRPSRG